MTSTTTIARPDARPPLARHVYSCTTDLDRAAAEGTRAVSPHRLRAQRAEVFSSRLHAASIGSSTLLYQAYGGAVDLDAVAPWDYYTVHLALQGGFQVTTEFGSAAVVPGTGCVVSPGTRLRIRFAPGLTQVAVKIPGEVLEQGIGRLGADDGSGALPVFALPVSGSAALLGALRLAVNSVDRCDSGVPHPQLGQELERMLVTALLLGQPHTAASRMLNNSGDRTRGFRAAGAVAEAMRAAPHEALDIAALARSAGVSLRTLQDGFRNRFGRSPSGYLRDLRLEQAHRLLRGAGGHGLPGAGSVTDIALACGFMHLGRFAQDYRNRYGRAPSATLAASRQADSAASSG